MSKSYAPTDAERADFLLKRMNDDEQNGCQEYYNRCGYYLYQISKLKGEFNECLERIASIKRHYWYEGNLIKRVLKKFKVKDIYRSKTRAYPYYKKYFNKSFKISPDIYMKDLPKEIVIQYIAQVGSDDFEHRLIYKYVIDRIKGDKTDVQD